MKPHRIEIDAEGRVPVWLAAGLLEGVGTSELARNFLVALERAMPASHCTIFALEQNGHASVISAASAYGDTAMVTAREYIRQGFDTQDSNMIWMARKKTPRRSQAWIGHQTADEVANPAYRRRCYGDTSIRERVSVLLLLDSGQRVAVSFYRNLGLEPYAAADLAWLSACAPILMAALVAHLRKVPGARPAAPLRERLLADLPRRQREVMAHVLEGRTTREVAALLRLSPTTILTYRYRAFATLGIRTQRELLALAHRSR